MQTTFAQKLGLLMVFGCVYVFLLIDKLGNALVNLGLTTLRVLALVFICATLVSFTTPLKVRPGELFDYLFYYPNVESSGLVIRQNLPRKIADVPQPQITAQSAIAIDMHTGKTLFELNPDLPLPPASTTKVMTYLTARSLLNEEDLLAVPAYCTVLDSQKAGFFPNEQLAVKDLYYALLISSAGDAACALADSEADFVQKMNATASELGLTKTKFSNAIGFDNSENQLSTSRDLAVLGAAALRDDMAREIVAQKNYQVSSSLGTHALTNTNRLLWEIPETIGLKTGTTNMAGEVLIYAYAKDDKQLEIVVMKSSDRFGDTKKILDWVLSSYSWQL